MKIKNHTPYPHFSFKHVGTGQLYSTIVMRGDFHLQQNGKLVLLDDQVGPRLTDAYYGPPSKSSLIVEHDRVPEKNSGEIYFINPISRPPQPDVVRWRASVNVKSIHHEFYVTGPRDYRRRPFGNWTLTDPSTCEEVFLLFEFTYGGQHPDDPAIFFDQNPVGTGYRLPYLSPSIKSVPGPQLESFPEKNWKHPIGLTPVHRAWNPRRNLAGTFDQRWRSDRWPFYPLDFSNKFYNQSPRSLQLSEGYFKGNEIISIEAIGQSNKLDIQLPESRQGYLLGECSESEAFALEFSLDTVVLDLEQPVVSLIWRITFPFTKSMHNFVIFMEHQDE